jgi:drug/metabolite transporter (DMT)-like permease
VLRPEEREDGELEVVRVSTEELLDPFSFPIGQPESAMQRLFGDLIQVIQCNRGNRRPAPAVNGGVSRRYPMLLGAVALLWGGSFLFIKVAVRELAPATLILGRLGLASLALAAIVPVLVGRRETVAELRANAGWLAVVGLVNVAIPFWLLSWGETRIASGLASIIQASVPIFNAVVAFGFFREVRVGGLRLVGVGIGFVGVALLVGAQPHGKVIGALAVCGMALCYAVGQLLAGRHLRQVQPPVVALGTTAVAALAALPAGIAQAPGQMPAWKTIGAVIVLAVPLTAVAFLLFYAIIAGAGAAYASLVTYLVPPIALAYGAVFLGERFAAADFAALVLILAGVVLGTGRVRLRRGGELASQA